ncbi:FtsK/SpoIIIE domain-containing protein [Polaromonas sp. CT11-55]|uniref:FtsK/SpoIIIE domain-containing protein n=1 Tax=Polaromonas sp. CT11-55 TaxID=3243045 RepID=UPI0039A4531A
MSAISLQQIMSSRFRTSSEADRSTVLLMSNLGLSTKANVARLAISRSMALGKLSDGSVDSKGLEIPASILFTQEDVTAWVGLIVTHATMHGGEAIDSMDAFRAAVRKHWHRGAQLLMQDWEDASGNFDKFLETLIIRRADLPDVAQTPSIKPTPVKVDKPQDASAILIKALAEIGVAAEIKGLTHGPRVSRYKVFLPDINQFDKLRRGLERLGLALNLQTSRPTLSTGDEAKTISLDVPRPASTWKPVGYAELRDWIASTKITAGQLPVYPGVDVLGRPYSFDLAAAPHLLVGGTTGSGKSVCLHALILSLVARIPPGALQLALIDPKQVEFAVYRGSPYLYRGEIAITASSAREMLVELVTEMEARYSTFMAAGVSNIDEARKKRMDIPYIVVVIEELADLLTMAKDIEDHIVRLAQKARAAGIHLVIATQRPDAKTFSGLVRSNIPARIALTVQKSTESTIILDESGAEDLLGAGDMLVKAKPGSQPERVHGVRIERSDIESLLREKSTR